MTDDPVASRSNDGEKDDRPGVRFLGEVTALLSHDIKNILAIINENAGLLKDLSMMAGGKSPVDPDRAGRIADKIQRQVNRADETVRRLNQVGHCMDEAVVPLDLTDTVATVCALAARKAGNKRVGLVVCPDAGRVTITSDPFLLRQLIWECVDRVIRMAAGGTVEITVLPDAAGAAVVFDPAADAPGPSARIRPGQIRPVGYDRLGAEVTIDNSGRLTIQLPHKMDT